MLRNSLFLAFATWWAGFRPSPAAATNWYEEAPLILKGQEFEEFRERIKQLKKVDGTGPVAPAILQDQQLNQTSNQLQDLVQVGSGHQTSLQHARQEGSGETEVEAASPPANVGGANVGGTPGEAFPGQPGEAQFSGPMGLPVKEESSSQGEVATEAGEGDGGEVVVPTLVLGHALGDASPDLGESLETGKEAAEKGATRLESESSEKSDGETILENAAERENEDLFLAGGAQVEKSEHGHGTGDGAATESEKHGHGTGDWAATESVAAEDFSQRTGAWTEKTSAFAAEEEPVEKTSLEQPVTIQELQNLPSSENEKLPRVLGKDDEEKKKKTPDEPKKKGYKSYIIGGSTAAIGVVALIIICSCCRSSSSEEEIELASDNSSDELVGKA